MDTAKLIPMVRKQSEQIGLIASGGLRNGLDIARSLRLGANMTAVAQPFLEPALNSSEAVIEKIDILSEQLRRAMFLTGSRDLKQLQERPADTRLVRTQNQLTSAATEVAADGQTHQIYRINQLAAGQKSAIN